MKRNEKFEKEIPLLIYLEDVSFESDAKRVSKKLSVDITDSPELTKKAELILHYSKNGLCLSDGQNKIMGDFTKMLPRLKQNNLTSELIVKAGKFKNADTKLTAIDATAGLGEDSLLLSAIGFNIKLFEYDPIIAELLKDTHRRALESQELFEIARRMEIIEGDSISYMNSLKEAPSLIYLDPMFPERQKSSLVKKKFQVIKHLEKPCSNEEELLSSAINAHPCKIIIKRPIKAPHLANIKPSYSINGKSIRYDVILK